jgi:hypothetical protein
VATRQRLQAQAREEGAALRRRPAQQVGE